MLSLALLIVVCMVTYTVEIIFGLAGTILMIMVMSFIIDTKTLVIFSALPQILVGTIGLSRSQKTVKLDFLLSMVIFASVGAVFGLYLFYLVPVSSFQYWLAAAITVFGFYLVFFPGKLALPFWLARLLDTLAGTSQALFGISGPIAMTRLLATFDSKIQIRNYALAFFLSMNLFRVSGYVWNGTLTNDILLMMAWAAPFLMATLWLANHLHLKVNERLFRRVVAWLILLGGISLFLH
ncbi:MAG: sulfite exporter TauE/SafE family protein [Gammaproteobacteria bacterium]|nr:sulfite exporter TauE/SafE family protein [Gammaproteobacteria bacterium]